MTQAEKDLSLMDSREAAAKTAAMHWDLHQQYIAVAAYYKAETRGFEPGFEQHDWRDAEIEALSGRGMISAAESNWCE